MNITFLGIHPDDIELGCGGTVVRAIADGHTVTLVDLSGGDSSSNGTVAERAREAAAAAEIFGGCTRLNLGLPDTKIHSEDAEQTAAVVDCVRAAKPSLVFIPNKNDPHPDHASGGKLIERALYLCGIQGFKTTHEAWHPEATLIYMGRLEVEPAFIMDVTAVQEVKMNAILAHRSQFIFEDGRKSTVLNSPDFLPYVESRSRHFGRMIGVRFGEPFQSMHPVPLHDFSLFEDGS